MQDLHERGLEEILRKDRMGSEEGAMKYAILSTTTDEEYSFYAPITARMWVEIGYKPYVFLGGSVAKDWIPNKANNVVFKELNSLCLEGREIAFARGCSKQLSIKLVRWYAACLSFFKPDDYLLTSDIDLWPLSFAWYSSQDPEKRYHLFNGDIHGGVMHSTCHIGASADRWRSLMKIKAGDDIVNRIELATEEAFKRHDSSWIGRRSDEQFMKSRILDHPSYPADFEFINRGTPPEGRIDRESWPEKVESGGGAAIDAHLLRPGTDPRVWKRVREVLPSHLRDWAESYRAEYMEARG